MAKKKSTKRTASHDYPRIIGATSILVAVLLLGDFIITHPWLSVFVIILTIITILGLLIAYLTYTVEGGIGMILSKILRGGK